MFLIQTPSGDTMLVDTLDGHADCTVLDANAPAMTLDDAKAMKRNEVDRYLAGQFLLGFTPAIGPVAGHTLQTRDNTDRTNWLTSQAAYLAQINAGNGAALGATFRTADNETVTCSCADGYSTLLEMAAWGKTLMGKSWTVKDQINALTNVADVLSYDVASGWAAA
jgi:hypothetical protein